MLYPAGQTPYSCQQQQLPVHERQKAGVHSSTQSNVLTNASSTYGKSMNMQANIIEPSTYSEQLHQRNASVSSLDADILNNREQNLSANSLKMVTSKSNPNLATIAEDVDSAQFGHLDQDSSRASPCKRTEFSSTFTLDHNLCLNKHACSNTQLLTMSSSLPNLLSDNDQRSNIADNVRLDLTYRNLTSVSATCSGKNEVVLHHDRYCAEDTESNEDNNFVQSDDKSPSSEDAEVSAATSNRINHSKDISASCTNISYCGGKLDVGIYQRNEEDIIKNPHLPRYTFTPNNSCSSVKCLSFSNSSKDNWNHRQEMNAKAWRSLSDIAYLAEEQIRLSRIRQANCNSNASSDDLYTCDNTNDQCDNCKLMEGKDTCNDYSPAVTPAIVGRSSINSRGMKPPPLYTRTSYPLLPMREQFVAKNECSVESFLVEQSTYSCIGDAERDCATDAVMQNLQYGKCGISQSSPNLRLDNDGDTRPSAPHSSVTYVDRCLSCQQMNVRSESPPPLPPKPARFHSQSSLLQHFRSQSNSREGARGLHSEELLDSLGN